jgi:glutamyl/glutaminyl-tRNA synthetase
MEKLVWLNREHIKGVPVSTLLHELALPDSYEERVLLVRENADTLISLKGLVLMFEDGQIEEDALHYLSHKPGMEQVICYLREVMERDRPDMEQIVHEIERRAGLGRKESFLALRIALTGRKSGPPLHGVYRLMPKGSILERLECLEKRLTASASI